MPPITITQSQYDASIARLLSRFANPSHAQAAIEAFNVGEDGSAWDVVPDPNYAETLQREAYSLAKYQLAKVVAAGDLLDGALARLAVIHERKLAEAADWVPPKMQRPLTAAEVTNVAVVPVAGALIAEAMADE